MLNRKKIIEENKELKKKLENQSEEIHYLYDRLNRPVNINNDTDLNLKYLSLIQKYNKLLDSCLSDDTESIIYNGELYGIQTIDFHKDAENIDTIDIRAAHIPREKGLANNLAEPFKTVGKELNKIFFANDNM